MSRDRQMKRESTHRYTPVSMPTRIFVIAALTAFWQATVSRAVCHQSHAMLLLITNLDKLCRERWRAAHLERLRHVMQSTLGKSCPTPIIPIVVGSADAAVRAAELLWQRGFHVPAIRPPTVPEGSSRLRVSHSAGHSEAEVRQLAEALRDVLAELNLLRARL